MKAKNILLDFKPFHIEAKYNARLKYFLFLSATAALSMGCSNGFNLAAAKF